MNACQLASHHHFANLILVFHPVWPEHAGDTRTRQDIGISRQYTVLILILHGVTAAGYLVLVITTAFAAKIGIVAINEGHGVATIAIAGQAGVNALAVVAISNTLNSSIFITKVEDSRIPVAVCQIGLHIIIVAIPELAYGEVVLGGAIVHIDIAAFETLRVVITPTVISDDILHVAQVSFHHRLHLAVAMCPVTCRSVVVLHVITTVIHSGCGTVTVHILGLEIHLIGTAYP